MVSIITPVFNCEQYIDETIQSVLNQTHEHWEMIIIDDLSSDNTMKIVKEYAKKNPKIKYYQNTVNSGPAKSRNKGIEMAQGRYISFLDGDDIWLPTFLEKSINFLETNHYNFVFSSYKRVDENLQPLYDDFIVPERVNYHSLLKTCPISCLTALIKIETIGKFYMPDIAKRQDYGLWLSILKKNEFAYGLKEPLAIYRIRKGSVSRNKFKAMYYVWKVYKDVEKLNSFIASYMLINYIINGLRKYSH